MITEMTKDQVTEIGARNRANYLLEQYGYILGLAKMDGDALTELLPDGYLEEAAQAAERVSEALKDRALSAEESKSSTQEVNAILRRAKIWRRAVNSRASRARRLGKNVPDGLLGADGVQGVPGITLQLEKMVKLVEANRAYSN